MPSEREHGFTLLEVLVAFTLLALTLVAVLGVFRIGMRTSYDAESYAVATLLARSKLATVGRESPLLTGRTAGDFENGYAWAMQVEPAITAATGDEEVIPYEVTLVVSWDGAGPGGRSVTLRTVRLGPPETRP